MKACDNRTSPQCKAALNDVYDQFNGYDIYAVYAECTTQRPLMPHIAALRQGYVAPKEIPPCTDVYSAHAYLNSKSVQEALHVENGKYPNGWEICADGNVLQYNGNLDTLVTHYQYMIQNGYRVLVYSGDTDAALPYLGTRAYIESLNQALKNKRWSAWTFPQANGVQVGGRVTEYANRLVFATVRGAGHMVPQYRPAAAYAMAEKFLSGEWAA
eukprot:NODE_5196_length_717_cov_56.091525_g5173_i0.p1 GENE.NODE_5196_length_717_cov_56.091525_g5173_i0~~NODE_5196_length_717_cov_56.091525_g5173_i0.p1  ORF type:complete len:234 (+),score=64.76 NODE_5196_length_717_cov_56.091525_g5173_i0:63-704(+)